MPEMCFWPAKSRKSLKFLRCIYVLDLVLKNGSDIIEETVYSFSFTSLF